MSVSLLPQINPLIHVTSSIVFACNPVCFLIMIPLTKIFRKKVRVAIRREAIRRVGKRILTSNGGLFSHIRSISKQKTAVSALRRNDGPIASLPYDKAQTLSSQF